MHIIDSDFTDTTGLYNDEGRQTELERIAEELRIKVRLGRYQQARDDMSDSSTDEDSHSPSDTALVESNLRPLEKDTADGDEVEVDSSAEESDIDGSGDEEVERMKNIELLKTIKTEIDEACAMNTDPINHPEPTTEVDLESADGQANVLSNQSLVEQPLEDSNSAPAPKSLSDPTRVDQINESVTAGGTHL